MGRKKELGKGIRALLSNIETTNTPEEKTELIKELNSTIIDIDINNIETNPYQPRSEFDQKELEELAQSIKVHGLIQAITVRSLGGDSYQLISGERRLRAAKLTNLSSVPAFVRVADDQAMLEMALIENIQRSNLNAIEVAISYQRLMDECSLTHEALSDRVGKNRSTITNYVRLLKLPPQIQSSIRDGQLSMGHARALAGIEDLGLQLDIYKTTLEKGLSVRALESLVRSYTNPAEEEEKVKPITQTDGMTPELRKLQRELSSSLGAKVLIKRNTKGEGQITIKYRDDEGLNTILDALQS